MTSINRTGGLPDRLFFLGISALLFATSTAVTIVWCLSMPTMCEMRMPGQTWSGAAASFLGMWIVMMVAMMLPSLVPTLWSYRQAISKTGETRLGLLTAIVGMGYFFVWTVFGLVAFPIGVALSQVPLLVGVVVLTAGCLQLTAWKARHLACCRQGFPASGTAWKQGLRLGLHCTYCCAGPTAILLAMGIMNLRAMVVVAFGITVERLAPAGERIAQAMGIVVIGAGLLLIARAW